MSQLFVYSGLEPQSTNPDPLSHEQLLCAHLAKAIQASFTEDSEAQQSLPSPQSVPAYSSFVFGGGVLAAFTGQSFKGGIFFET